MTPMSRHQLRTARALLLLRQELLADLADVGVASIRRFENGTDIDPDVVEKVRVALEAEGAVLVPAGAVVDGRRVGLGVTLRPDAELPVETKARLAALDATPEQAAARLSRKQADQVGKISNVGKRTRLPYEPPSRTRDRRRSIKPVGGDG